MDTSTYEAALEPIHERQRRSRPADTPAEIRYPIGLRTLPEHVDHWAAQDPGRRAIVQGDRVVTYEELAVQHARWAGWLRSQDVAEGTRVGIHMGNAIEFVSAFLGTLRAGCVHVPINPMFQHAELVHELTDSGAQVVLTVAPLAERLCVAAAEAGVEDVVVVGDGELPNVGRVRVHRWEQVLTTDPLAECVTDVDALAALNYTGGTTGLPKGCEHSQRNMVYTAASVAGACALPGGARNVSLCFIPIFWIAGEDFGILIPIVVGGTSVLMERWDAATTVDLIERYRVTSICATVENYLAILELPGIEKRDLSSLSRPMAMSFIRKLDPEVRRRWGAIAGPTSTLREAAYGMTETNTCDAIPYGFERDDHDLLAQPVFCGLPVPETDILIIDAMDGTPMPLGETGEIIVRSPAVTSGYWQNPEATSRQLVDGWLRTGDSGFLDEDGCLHYLARSKEMMKINGMSVFPAEIEMLLSRHDAVMSVAVVAASDPRTGERPVAFVTLREGEHVTAQELHDWAAGTMASYKVPTIEVLPSFPLTATGKIRKVELAERAQALLD